MKKVVLSISIALNTAVVTKDVDPPVVALAIPEEDEELALDIPVEDEELALGIVVEEDEALGVLPDEPALGI